MGVMAAGEVFRTEDVCKDGLSYKIDVYQSYSGYWATWTCRSCNSSGVLSAAPSVAEAIGNAETALFSDHHLPVHRFARPTRRRT